MDNLITATNTHGMTAKWIPRGATLTELHVPDAQGNFVDVVLGFDDLAGYESGANQHFGCTTGRFANRIRDGKFTLDGTEYQLAVNNGPNHLHGGTICSLDKVVWQAEPLDDSRGVKFSYTSPDGEESYPGNLNVSVTYTLSTDNALWIEYEATTDAPTIINLTNHSYFNLSGHGSTSILNHALSINADRYTPVDETAIPTGELASVAGTPFDFRESHVIGERMAELIETPAGGYDHNFVLNEYTERSLRLAARVSEPISGRVMTVHTDQPGVQFYTANGLSGQLGKGGKPYQRHSAFCLETQNFPDAPNRPEFPTAVLRPGETYRHTCTYAFSAE